MLCFWSVRLSLIAIFVLFQCYLTFREVEEEMTRRVELAVNQNNIFWLTRLQKERADAAAEAHHTFRKEVLRLQAAAAEAEEELERQLAASIAEREEKQEEAEGLRRRLDLADANAAEDVGKYWLCCGNVTAVPGAWSIVCRSEL